MELAATMCFRHDLFQGQKVLVTGGTSGIGAAVARCFHGLGASVTAIGLAADVAPLVCDERLRLVEIDVTESAPVEALISTLDRLDHLVLCAGISLNERERELDHFRQVIEVNLVHTMTVAMAASPLLSRQGGCIVTIASMYAFFGSAERPAYSASKGGIVQLTKSLAQLFASRGIRVNSVAPGWIETPLARNLDEDTRAQIKVRIPVDRWGASDEVASVILFLCSPAASYVTGVVLPVDGGYLIA